MVKRWNDRVQPEDTVYYLGDFSMKPSAMERFVKRLNGTIVLVAGNHDLLPGKKLQRHETYKRHFAEVLFDTYITEEFMGKLSLIRLCHFPYAPPENEKIEGYDLRYLDLRPKKGSEDWLLHGHVHNSWKRRGNMINVGADQWDFQPISLQEIEQFVRSSG